MHDPSVCLRVRGDYALFSRPEFKVERVSYPIITPSAARGALEAVYWKPEFKYRIRRIGVVKIGSTATVLRNELGTRQGKTPVFIEDDRQQRSSLLLKDVEYLIHADIVVQPHAHAQANGVNLLIKHTECFKRRAQSGQCRHQPYLGTREFSAEFEAATPDEQPDRGLNQRLGNMLLDIAFVPSKTRKEMQFKRHDGKKWDVADGYMEAVYFNADLKDGWVDVVTDTANPYARLDALEGRHA
ncbi:type I-C CRISPR-associated protein Cas5c [Deinococcus multiflagellatus]|uniref:type I-C CRISPR-associated protein Cas5c n=1 Tax=Deinococcus multiflagellatus TaxID=1656887 RepID=UPI001CCCE954|nr:type I-C CRISPR-associated protein Cas5c [Deinococcus multiflagellatus]MBZ9713502.1 type I-C CRISPR-associated protein Cas5c [Deinococcus multiflagellatus]